MTITTRANKKMQLQYNLFFQVLFHNILTFYVEFVFLFLFALFRVSNVVLLSRKKSLTMRGIMVIANIFLFNIPYTVRMWFELKANLREFLFCV